MAVRNPRTQLEHDQIVNIIANNMLINRFRDVRADIEEFPRPGRIIWADTDRGHIPDATGKMGGVEYVVEVETGDTIKGTHTANQWKLFSAYAEQYGANFVVVVPESYETDARMQLFTLGLNAEVLGI